MHMDKVQKVDVICQHGHDGTLIPLKVRVRDDDGGFQVFVIKAYREVSHPGGHIMPNGIPSTTHTWQFECKIQILDMEKRIKLFYNAYDNFWKLDFAG